MEMDALKRLKDIQEDFFIEKNFKRLCDAAYISR